MRAGADELDRLLGLALQSGRLRAVYGPGGESAATRLYRRLPSGRDVGASAAEVNEALRSLSGQVLDDVVVTVHGPGAFGLVARRRRQGDDPPARPPGRPLHAVGI